MASDIAIAAQEILKTRARLNEIYAEHTNQNIEAIEKVMDRDTWYDTCGTYTLHCARF